MAPREFFDEQHVQRSYERVLKDVEAYRALGRTALQAIEFGNATFEARDYQTEAWDALRLAREDGKDSALVHLATGLGKTTIGVVDALDFAVDFYEREGRPPKVMFAVHQKEILNQAAERFEEFAPSLSHGVYAAGQKSTDHPLTFATMQSLAQNLDNLDPSEFDYILYDEAHHTQAQTHREVVKHFTPEFKLALTATPERMDEEDIRDLFGNEVYSKPLSEAMAEGHLVDVNYHIVFDDAVKRAMDDGFTARTLSEIRGLLTNESRNEQIVAQIRAEKQRLGIEKAKTIVFCHNIEQANEMAELLGGKPYHSAVGSEREQTLQAFRNGDLQTITTRDMFNEGIDVPDAQLLIFLRSTSSQTVFEQQLGRGLRKHPGKEAVSVLDFVANIERLTQVRELSDLIARHQSKHGNEASTDKHHGGLKIHTEHADFDFDKLSMNLIDKYLEIQEKSTITIPESLQEAAELWNEICPGVKPTSTLIRQKSTEGVFISYDRLNALGGIKNFRFTLGYESRPEPSTIEEAAELWNEICPGVKPTPALIRQKSTEGVFITIDKLYNLGNVTNLQSLLGYETRAVLKPATIEEAAELWNEICPGVKPTQRLIRQKSKEGLFVSFDRINEYGGLNKLVSSLGYESRPEPSTIEEAAELWNEICPGVKPTHRSVKQKSKEGVFISSGKLENLGGLKKLVSSLGYESRPEPSTIEEAAELWNEICPGVKPVYDIVAEKSKTGEFISYKNLQGLGGLEGLQSQLGYRKVKLSTIEEAAELWNEICPGVKPTHALITQKFHSGEYASTSIIQRLGGIKSLHYALGYKI